MTEETTSELKLFITNALQEQDLRWHKEFTKKFNKLDAKIDVVHDKLDAKIDVVHDKLDAKINAVYNKLDAKIDHLAVTAFDALDTYHADHEQRIQKLETHSP